MKLQRFKTRTVGDKDYHKWVVNLPSKLMEKMGWESGDELDAQQEGDSIVIRRKPARKG